MSRHRYIRCRLWTYRLLLAGSGQAAFRLTLPEADIVELGTASPPNNEPSKRYHALLMLRREECSRAR